MQVQCKVLGWHRKQCEKVRLGMYSMSDCSVMSITSVSWIIYVCMCWHALKPNSLLPPQALLLPSTFVALVDEILKPETCLVNRALLAQQVMYLFLYFTFILHLHTTIIMVSNFQRDIILILNVFQMSFTGVCIDCCKIYIFSTSLF